MLIQYHFENFYYRHPESIDDLRVLYENKERKIFKKQQTYKAFRDKLAVSIFYPLLF